MTKEVRLRSLLAAAAFAALLAAAGNAVPASAGPRIELTEVNCLPGPEHAGALDVIRLHNRGDAPQDLRGWQLKSDPEVSESMALDIAGTLDPVAGTPGPDSPLGDKPWVIIVAGIHATQYPESSVWLWSVPEVLRDSGDPPDYVRLYDADGNLVDSMDCNGNPVPLETTAQETPTPEPQVTNTNNPEEGTQPGGQTGSTTASQTAGGTSSEQAATTGQTAAQAASGGSFPAPNSGLGSLAPVNTSPLRLVLGLGAIGAGLAGLTLGVNLFLRRRARRT
jgi:hypothetical protein